MSDAEKKSIRKKYTTLALVLPALIAVYIIASVLILKRVTIVYNIVIIVGLLAFWAIMDILIPIRAHEFEGKTQAQVDAWKKYAAADLLGYVGLMYFALAMQSSTGIYGALAYVVSHMIRNRFQEEFDGTQEEDTVDSEGIEAADDTEAVTKAIETGDDTEADTGVEETADHAEPLEAAGESEAT